MVSDERLAVPGYRDEPVPTVYLRQPGAADRIAVLLPGQGYTAEMPLFYYAEDVLIAAGADVLRVDYRYHQRPAFGQADQDERQRWLLTDATAVYRTARARRPEAEIVLVGKSLGTISIAHLLASESSAAAVRAVWLTPLLHLGSVRTQIIRSGARSLVAIGSADPVYEPAVLDQARAAGCAVVTVDGADHGFDIPGDVIASLRAVEAVVRDLEEFLRRA